MNMTLLDQPLIICLFGICLCLLFVLPLFWLRLKALRAEASLLLQTSIAPLQQALAEKNLHIEQQHDTLENLQGTLLDNTEQILHLEKQNSAFMERVAQFTNLQTTIGAKDQQIAQLQENVSAQRSMITELETQLKAERKQIDEKIRLLESAKLQMTAEFQNLAQRIFEEKSARFTHQNQENMGSLLTPLREQLLEFKTKVEDIYNKDSNDRVLLLNQISTLKALNERIGQDALNLTNALKGQAKTQGNWGEMVLERVLEQSGLVKGREYEIQVSATNSEGARLQPDVIVHLPEQKDVIIDAKVSLLAYQRYYEAETPHARDIAINQHVTSIRSHIKGLSHKDYSALNGFRSLDFVLLFIPIEAAFITAVEFDQSLFNEAFAKHIIIVSPSTLFATLRTIEHIWRYEYQNQNAQDIARKGGDLYDKFVNFINALDDVGEKLNRAQESYDTAYKRLNSGRGNIVSKIQELKLLGATTKKSLPENLIEQAQLGMPDE
ncbi:MAG: DNA recombination protein RmuC [Methylococcales bacterium]